MATLSEEYKRIPTNGVELSKTKKFLQSNMPFQVILAPELLPPRTSVDTMVTACLTAVEELLEKYNKYKELGYFHDDIQPIGLGQLTNNSTIAKNYIIAVRWKKMPEAEKAASLTKARFIEILNDWFSYHKDRIGWSSFSFKTVTIQDPATKKVIKYNLADRYNKPINQCKYPDFSKTQDPRFVKLASIRISVAQAEVLLLSIVDKYVNENDVVDLAGERQDIKDAYTLITTLSGYRTDSSKTWAGTKQRAQQSYTDIQRSYAIRKRRKQLELAALKKEEQVLAEIAQRNKDLTELSAQLEQAQQEAREAFLKKEEVSNDYLTQVAKIRNGSN